MFFQLIDIKFKDGIIGFKYVSELFQLGILCDWVQLENGNLLNIFGVVVVINI